MGTPTRFPDGVTNRPVSHVFGTQVLPDRTKLYQFFDDFDHSDPAAGAGVAQWNAIAASATTAYGLISAVQGQALFAPQAANAAFGVVRWSLNTTPLPLILPVAGKKFWLASRFKTEDADQNNLFIGGSVSTVDPFGTEPADQFVFRSLNAAPDALVLAVGPTATTEVTISLGTTLDDTWTTCFAHYDGRDTVTAGRYLDNGTLIAKGSVSVNNGALLPDAALAPTFGMQNKDTGADDFTIDFFYMAQER